MEKLTALEVEKIGKFQELDQAIIGEKVKLADLLLNKEALTLNLDNSVKVLLSKLVSHNEEVLEFNKGLTSKYGEGFTISPEFEVIKPNNNKEVAK